MLAGIQHTNSILTDSSSDELDQELKRDKGRGSSVDSGFGDDSESDEERNFNNSIKALFVHAKNIHPSYTNKKLIDIKYGDDEDSLLHVLIDKFTNEYTDKEIKETINYLVEQGIDVNSRNKYGYIPLHLAVETGNANYVIALIEAGADANTFNIPIEQGTNNCFYAVTPLHIAAANGNLDIVKILVEEKKINSVYTDNNIQKISPIHLAMTRANDKYPKSKQQCLNVIKYLISCLEVNAQDSDGRTALHYAVQDHNADAVELLLTKKNIDPFIKDNEGKTPFDYTREGNNGRILSAIISTKYTRDKDSLLHLAAEKGDVKAVKYLIKDQGIDVNLRNDLYHTPLHLAAGNGHTDVVQTLINEGKADINIFDCRNHTPLHYAVNNKKLDMVKLLLDLGADINAVGIEEYSTQLSPLHIAVSKRGNDKTCFNIAKYLVNFSATKINLQDYEKKSPLHYATDYNDLDTIKILLARKDIDLSIKDDRGKTPFDYAKDPILINIRDDYNRKIANCKKEFSSSCVMAIVMANFILAGLYVNNSFLKETIVGINQKPYIYTAFMLGVNIMIGAGLLLYKHSAMKSIAQDFKRQVLNIDMTNSAIEQPPTSELVKIEVQDLGNIQQL